MTKREKFELVANLVNGAAVEFDREEMLEWCGKEIAALDAKNEKAKERAAEKRAAGDELQARIYALMGEEPMTINDIVAALGDEDLTPARVVARMKNLVKAEEVAKTAVKVEGRKLVGYTRA